MIRTDLVLVLLLALAVSGCTRVGAGTWQDYEQLLPRGAISAITEPIYVDAADAIIADDAYVLGVVVEGKALAYSLNLLNDHEVVNDRIGGTSFAAVW